MPGVSFYQLGEGQLGSLVRSFDWSTTPIGPRESWSKSLKAHVSMMLALPTPAIIFWGEDQIQIYNDGYSTIMGPRHPKYLGSPFRDGWPEAFLLIDPWMKRVTQKAEVVIVERNMFELERFGFKDEGYFTFTFSPLREDDGNIGGLLQIVTEVTSMVLSERRTETLRIVSSATTKIQGSLATFIKALSSNPNDIRFALIFLRDTSSDGLKLVGQTGIDIVPEYSQGFGELSKIADEVLTSGTETRIADIQAILPHTPAAPWPERTRQAIALPIQSSKETLPQGVVVFGISPRLNFNEEYQAFFYDLARTFAMTHETDRHRLDELQKALSARDEFISIASHELKTPLTTIQLQIQYQDIIAQKAGAGLVGFDLLQKSSKLVSQQLRRLTALVNDLLDVSRISADKLTLNLEKTNISKLLTELLDREKVSFASAKIPVSVEIQENIEMYADQLRIEQVINNLISNAIKYAPGTPIAIRLYKEQNQLILEVIDHGKGIAPENQQRIFERYERISKGTKTTSGLGLGLYITHQIVKAHNGIIRVESTLGKGSRFIVEFPD